MALLFRYLEFSSHSCRIRMCEKASACEKWMAVLAFSSHAQMERTWKYDRLQRLCLSHLERASAWGQNLGFLECAIATDRIDLLYAILVNDDWVCRGVQETEADKPAGLQDRVVFIPPLHGTYFWAPNPAGLGCHTIVGRNLADPAVLVYALCVSRHQHNAVFKKIKVPFAQQRPRFSRSESTHVAPLPR